MFMNDFQELLSAFNAHQVKYLIVGGYAVAIHAQPAQPKSLVKLSHNAGMKYGYARVSEKRLLGEVHLLGALNFPAGTME